MKKGTRTLIVVRHAHRDTSRGRTRDNGLSERGRHQTDQIRKKLESRLEDKDPSFVSSPKRRCLETVVPLATALGARVRVSALLDEQHGEAGESAGRFLGRVRRFFTWCQRRGPKTLVVCSHGDWIPELIRLVEGKPRELKKGEWVRLKL